MHKNSWDNLGQSYYSAIFLVIMLVFIYILTKGYHIYSNKVVDRYLSPVSGNKMTMFLPLFSGLLANSVAA